MTELKDKTAVSRSAVKQRHHSCSIVVDAADLEPCISFRGDSSYSWQSDATISAIAIIGSPGDRASSNDRRGW